MSATPGAGNEYSRGQEGPRRGASPRRTGGSGGSGRGSWLPSGTTRGAILAGALLGALLLFVAEFTALYTVHAATTTTRTVGTGSNDSYALVPLALLAAFLGIAVFRAGSRPALLAIGLVGIVALFIALLGDLPDAHRTGYIGSFSTHVVNASSTPSAGLYLETLGAILLIATCVLGFLGLGRPEPVSRGGGKRPPGQRGEPRRRPPRSVS